MPALSSGLDYVDLEFLGRPQIIATAILHGSPGVALIDPGPTTTIPSLTSALTRKGIAFDEVRQILVTHIHLDHSGSVGSIVAQHPHIQVVVHRRGAPHLIDPSKLMASAGRLYGQDMDRLWGEVTPVPATNITIVDGGETLAVVVRERRIREKTPDDPAPRLHVLEHVLKVLARSPVRAEVREEERVGIPCEDLSLAVVPRLDVDVGWRRGRHHEGSRASADSRGVADERHTRRRIEIRHVM